MSFTSLRFLPRLRIAFCALLALSATAASAATINEFRRDQTSTDTNEYFELAGTPGESLNGLSFIVIGDGSAAAGSGVLESIISLNGQTIPSDGFFLAAMNTIGNGDIEFKSVSSPSIDQDITSANDFENSDNVTILLVSGLTGTTGTDLDTNDDGTLNSTPWTTVLDAVGLTGDASAPVHLVYGSSLGFSNVGPDGGFSPAHIYRIPDASGGWNIGPFGGGDDTPGVSNLVPEPTSVALSLLAAFWSVVGFGRRRS
jgi:hypothetical protein